MKNPADTATTGRDGDLQERIARLLHARRGGAVPTVTGLRRVFGGNARKAWAFELDSHGDAATPSLPCILLSQAPGRHVESDATDEYRVLEAMTGHGLRAPAALALDADGEITGEPAIILERVDGDANAVAFLNPKDRAVSTRLTRELAEVTADLHVFDWRRAKGLADPGQGAALLQIEDWQARYLQARQTAHPPLTYLFGWLKDHLPTPPQLSLVHGDLRPGNFLYLDGRISALLDWEMAHIGDPAEDIAWIYRSLWSPQAFVPLSTFLDIYDARAGTPIDRRRVAYYRIFSEVKFATLSIVASASFATGKSTNLRHIDRAAKVAASVAQSFALIAETDWSALDVAA
jgi:aminoglycoside phosphotransferase (APT) family kinase protein